MNVLVVGAGIIGVSVADALARAGAVVTVLDMRSPGRGASQASAGMLAPYIEAHENPRLLELGTRSLALFDDVIAQLADDSTHRVEYARTGTLEVALDFAAADRLKTQQRLLASLGVAADYLDAPALYACEPHVTTGAVAGLLTHVHGLVGVDSLMRALVHRARQTGAVFESPIEAAGVDDLGTHVEVRAGTDCYRADVAVIAAGSWSGGVRVKNTPALPLRPVRGQLLHLNWQGARRPGRITWGPRCYAVPWLDGSLLVGATVEEAGFDEDATVAGIRDLSTAAAELLPAAASAHLHAVRVGLRPALPDGLPAIGPLANAPRVVMATGHYRNGVLLAPLTAQMVSRLILEGIRDEAMTALSPDRFLS